MSKRGKITIAIILIVLVLIFCIITLSNNSNISNENFENEIKVENIVEKNIIEDNSLNNENVVNEIIENHDSENMIIDTEVPETDYQSKDVYENNPNVGTTDKKQEAIDLVKNTWGEDDTVTFSCDSITSDGEYIIAVIDKQGAVVKNYFRVNLENKSVTVEF